MNLYLVKNVKLRGGVLPFVLTLSVVISSMCLMMILMVYYHKLEVSSYRIKLKLSKNATSGFNYLLSSNEVPYTSPLHFDLFGDGNDSVLCYKKPWGLFEVYYVKAHQGEHNHHKIGLIGEEVLDFGDLAVFLSDQNTVLSLIGDTEIVGNALLPQAGVKEGYMNNRSYSGTELIYGSIHTSQKHLPRLREDLLNYITSFEKGLAYEPLIAVREHNKKYSFSRFGTYIIEEGRTLVDDSLQGNLIIKAKDVEISASAHTENILVIAETVIIEDGFRGSLQVFASDHVKIGANCNLTYPSGITCYSPGNSGITIGETSRISGYLVNLGNSSPGQTALKLEKGASIVGYAYCKGSVELKGSIDGTILCDNFLYQPGRRMNNLVDAKINVRNRSMYMLAPLIFPSEGNLKIVDWLE